MLKNTRSSKKRAAIAVTPSRLDDILYVPCDRRAQFLTHGLAAGLCILNYPEHTDYSVTLLWQARNTAHTHNGMHYYTGWTSAGMG